jgi:hypothetical protein
MRLATRDFVGPGLRSVTAARMKADALSSEYTNVVAFDHLAYIELILKIGQRHALLVMTP